MFETPPMLQDEREFNRLLELIADIGARSYLEIGAKFGGSLYRIGMAMPAGSECVAVDLPAGTKVWPESERSLRAVAAELATQARPCTLIWGDSTNSDVVATVRDKRTNFDAVLIDANHHRKYVERDWANYGPMANKLVIFHDIAWYREPEWKGTRIDVPEFWKEIRGARHYTEIRCDGTRRNNGIGVIFVDGGGQL